MISALLHRLLNSSMIFLSTHLQHKATLYNNLFSNHILCTNSQVFYIGLRSYLQHLLMFTYHSAKNSSKMKGFFSILQTVSSSCRVVITIGNTSFKSKSAATFPDLLYISSFTKLTLQAAVFPF